MNSPLVERLSHLHSNPPSCQPHIFHFKKEILNEWKTTNYSFSHLGNPRKWICIKSPTATETEAHDTKTSASCNAHPVAVAMLCSRWALIVRGDMENSSSSITKSTSFVSFTSRSIAFRRRSHELFCVFCSSCIFDIITSMATTKWKSKVKLRWAISDVFIPSSCNFNNYLLVYEYYRNVVVFPTPTSTLCCVGREHIWMERKFSFSSSTSSFWLASAQWMRPKVEQSYKEEKVPFTWEKRKRKETDNLSPVKLRTRNSTNSFQLYVFIILIVIRYPHSPAWFIIIKVFQLNFNFPRILPSWRRWIFMCSLACW